MIVISNLGQMGWYDGAWFWAILLIAGGVWLYRQDTYGPRTSQDPAPDRPFDPNMTATSATTAVHPGYVARPAPKVSPVKVRTPHSRLGRYTFAIGLVVLGTLATFDNAGTIDLSPGEYAAAALITAGAGLLVGSVFGRARNLIFWGLLLVPFVLFADTTDIPFSQGTGERIYTPIAAGDIGNDYELFAGHMVFQLDDMEWDSEPVIIDANVFMGQMEIFVPQGVDVRFEGHAEMGGLRFFDIERTGTDVNLNIDEDTGNGPELILNTGVVMGEVVVHRTEEQAKELS